MAFNIRNYFTGFFSSFFSSPGEVVVHSEARALTQEVIINNPAFSPDEISGDEVAENGSNDSSPAEEKFFDCFDCLETLKASFQGAKDGGVALAHSSASIIKNAVTFAERSLTERHVRISFISNFIVALSPLTAIPFIMAIMYLGGDPEGLTETMGAACLMTGMFLGFMHGFFNVAETGKHIVFSPITASLCATAGMLPITTIGVHRALYSMQFYIGAIIISFQVLRLAASQYEKLVTYRGFSELGVLALYQAAMLTSAYLKRPAVGSEIPSNINDCAGSLCRSYKSSDIVGIDINQCMLGLTGLFSLLACLKVFKCDAPYKSIVIHKYLSQTVIQAYLAICFTQFCLLLAKGEHNTAFKGRGLSNIPPIIVVASHGIYKIADYHLSKNAAERTGEDEQRLLEQDRVSYV
jgi:hypothetical protein